MDDERRIFSISEQAEFGFMTCRQVATTKHQILDFLKSGDIHQAVFLYKELKGFVHLSLRTSVMLLKACSELKDVEAGHKIHADICGQGLERDVIMGSALISFYANCIYFEKAQKVFNMLSARDIVCWNTLIAGYAKHGHGEKALYYADQMQLAGICPNTMTFVCCLKACSSLGRAFKGQELHTEIVRRDLFKEHHFVGNALVNMYATCGLLAQAAEVFRELMVRDSVAWTALVVGYANAGFIKMALNYLDQMKSDGFSPTAMAIYSVLKGCSAHKSVLQGLELHTDMVRNSFLEKHPAIGIRLVDMYGRSGWFKHAQEVLDEYCAQDVVAWTSLITYYVKYELCEEALRCYKLMQKSRVSPNSITFICCLKACSKMGALGRGQELHNEINRRGCLLERDLAICNALLDMYANCGSVIKVQEVFNKLDDPDVVSWTALITGYTNNEHGAEALKCFKQMKVKGVIPDAVTYASVLKACASIGAAEKGIEVHNEIFKNVLLREDLVIANALIDMYANCGLLWKAQHVLNQLSIQDVISWTALIAGFVKYGYDEEALDRVNQMRQKGILLDDFALAYGLEVCGNLGVLGKGHELHVIALSRSLALDNHLLHNAIIGMYCKCGLVSIATEIFDAFASKDQVSWNALIAGYAQLGEITNALFLYDKLVEESNNPNSITFISILTACSHAGLVDLGHVMFEIMTHENSIIPSLDHFTCMIDLLGRAGQLEKMVTVIRQVPYQPSLVMWHSSLSACRKWNNVELRRVAIIHALQVDDNNDGLFYAHLLHVYESQDITTKFMGLH